MMTWSPWIGLALLSIGMGPPPEADVSAIVRTLADRSSPWLSPPDALESLEYDIILSGSSPRRIRARRGEAKRPGVWMGATLRAGFHALTLSPETFEIEVRREPGAKTFTIIARPKDPKGFIRVEVGNGANRDARESRIVIDAEAMVPIEEQTGRTYVRYSDWLEVEPGRRVPRQVEVVSGTQHFRMHFDWIGDQVWLLRYSESIDPEETAIQSRTRDVVANGRPIAVPTVPGEARSREARRAIAAMLDANQPWLDPGPNGAGWKPPFQTLSYTFHTLREDIREAAAIDRDGRGVLEVVGDGMGKLKGRLGDRRILLKGPEYAMARRGDRFAWIHDREGSASDPPFNPILEQTARIGCRLDLPLFHYRDLIDSASVDIEDGKWDGRPCRVATVKMVDRRAVLGCGTMFAFTSWSYVHDLRPAREVLYIDAARNVPVHETFVSSRDGRTFEIDFGDRVEVEPGRWAPLSIRIESRDYFTCEYRFQIVGGRHWMLRDVVSWFKPGEKSRGVLEDIKVDAGPGPIDEALQQVAATRSLFASEGEPSERINVTAVPFVVGRPIRVGPYEARVTMTGAYEVVVSASTADRRAPGTVPFVFLDEKGRPLFALSVSLREQGGARRGAATVRGTRAWRDVRSILAPGGELASVRVVPLRWGHSIAVNIPDALEGTTGRGDRVPRKGLTRAFAARVDRDPDGTARLVLDLVSIDGVHEFALDVSAALLDGSGEVAACGNLSTKLDVLAHPVERKLQIPLGKVREGSAPEWLAIGIAPGDVISSPMGRLRFTYFRNGPPIEVDAMLTAPDAGMRRIGLESLDEETSRSIQTWFLGHRFGKESGDDGPRSVRTRLVQVAGSLSKIAREPGPAEVRAAAARLLAYSEAVGAADVLAPMVGDPDAHVREAAAVGLTYLGRSDQLETIGAILDRPPPAAGATRRDLLAEQDAILAPAHQRSDAAIDLLGARLRQDIEGRRARAAQIVQLLGRSRNPRAVRWLVEADDLVAGRPDLAQVLSRSEIIDALFRFPDQVKDRAVAELQTGPAAADWAHALGDTADPRFLPAIRRMLLRGDMDDRASASALRYLRDVGTLEAVDAMREAYDRRLLKGDPMSWLTLCEALAAKGDGRGLPVAFAVLVDLERSAVPPADERKRNEWQSARDRRKDRAEDVFQESSMEILTAFLARKAGATAPEERRVVLRLLSRLPEVPPSIAAVVPAWARDPDPMVAAMAARWLKRSSPLGEH